MGLVTLSDLQSRTRSRAEIASAYVTDAVLATWINASIAELWRFIASINEDWLIADQPQSISVVSGTASYALYPDHWLLAGVDLLDGSDWRNLQPYRHADRNRLGNGSSSALTRYRVAGSRLRLAPSPTWSGTIRIWYVPTPPALASASATGGVATAGSATLTGLSATTAFVLGSQVALSSEDRVFRLRSKGASTVTLDRAVETTATGVAVTDNTLDTIAGFDEFVILSACIKFCALEESDPSVYMAQLGELKNAIRTAVAQRDLSGPSFVRNVRLGSLEEEIVDGIVR